MLEKVEIHVICNAAKIRPRDRNVSRSEHVRLVRRRALSFFRSLFARFAATKLLAGASFVGGPIKESKFYLELNEVTGAKREPPVANGPRIAHQHDIGALVALRQIINIDPSLMLIVTIIHSRASKIAVNPDLIASIERGKFYQMLKNGANNGASLKMTLRRLASFRANTLA